MLTRTNQGQVTKEPTMRHALIPIHLIQEARIQEARAAVYPPAREVADAPPDPQPADAPRRRRTACLVRWARALAARPT
jgi:hypothetical protein